MYRSGMWVKRLGSERPLRVQHFFLEERVVGRCRLDGQVKWQACFEVDVAEQCESVP